MKWVRILTLIFMVFALMSDASAQTAADVDYDGSGVVDIQDFLQFVAAFGSSTGQDAYNAKYDLNNSGSVDIQDFLAFVNLFGQTVTPISTGSVEGDREALIVLYNATDGWSWKVNTNWLSDKPLGEWYGVTTNAHGRVDSLDLSYYYWGNNLSGSIPAELGNLGDLIFLDLGLNDLTGSIPAELGNLRKLKVLSLSKNKLSGPIPESLGNLTKLETLSLFGNGLSGAIPKEIGNLTKLETLFLSQNDLTGPIPDSFLNITALTRFWADDANCVLKGPSWSEWVSRLDNDNSSYSRCPSISVRDARAALVVLYNATDGANWKDNTNWLTDKPLGEWYGVEGKAGSVESLMLQGNYLYGTLPAELGNLRDLTYLNLGHDRLGDSRNNLSGPIPAELGNLTDLTYLDLDNNNLTGSIPESLGNLTNLTYLDLYENDLSGPIPAELGNLTELTYLDLSYNGLIGYIPENLGNLIKLEVVRLRKNKLSGPIPESLGNLTNLTTLLLSHNDLTGPIPESLGNLTKLQYLFLAGNRLAGSVPMSFLKLTNLKTITMDEDTICLPNHPGFDEWFRRRLVLYIDRCGTTPTVVTGEGSAGEDRAALVAFYNATGGAKWARYSWNWLGYRDWYGVGKDTQGRVVSLTLRQVKLSGALPESLGNLKKLTYLDLYKNDLSGPIPESLGKLTELTYLDLSYNDLIRSIPASLGNLSNLEILYLNNNDLKGPIPDNFLNLTALTHFKADETNCVPKGSRWDAWVRRLNNDNSSYSRCP